MIQLCLLAKLVEVVYFVVVQTRVDNNLNMPSYIIIFCVYHLNITKFQLLRGQLEEEKSKKNMNNEILMLGNQCHPPVLATIY